MFGTKQMFKIVFALVSLTVLNFYAWRIARSPTVIKVAAYSRSNNSLKVVIWEPPIAVGWMGVPRDGYGCIPECFFTNNKSEAVDADAVAFIAVVKKGREDSEMPERPIGRTQIRIFVVVESPHIFGPARPNLPNSNHFNWTLTYRLDSDIYWPYYGRTVLKPKFALSQKTVDALQSHQIPVLPSSLKLYGQIYLKNKKKLIAWTVSHCKTDSGRELLAAELQKYVPVDIYGKCGPLKCPTDRSLNYGTCYQMLGVQYKFYLSFENSLCHDYLTEKIFLPLRNGLVPIVYGGANYTELAPPGSFINVLDFDSVSKLADHINFLDQNPAEYLKYFLWKEYYDIAEDDGWCTLCRKLKNVSLIDEHLGRVVDPKYSKQYPNISDWFYHKPYASEEEPKELACIALQNGTYYT